MDTNGLFDVAERTFTHVSYTRSNELVLRNPYNGTPGAALKMERVTVDKDTEELISSDVKPEIEVPFVPDRVYEMRDPRTKQKIPGVTFTAAQFYAMAYTITAEATGS